jgi:uroporphyrinogen-III synthase
MKSKVVAILETRAGAHLAEMIARLGAVPMHAPALEEMPEVAPDAVAAVLREWRADPFKMAIFQTGVGTRALFQMTDSLGSTSELLQLLDAAVVVVRGPKPVGELNARRVRIDIRAASPFTTETVLGAVANVPLDRRRVLVQRYGAANRELCDALQARGATVHEIATYRWALPADTGPLERLIDALTSSRVDAVVFTSAVQVQNLSAIAAGMSRGGNLGDLLKGVIVASIGPVCSRMLLQHGIKPSFEADPPKLGPLLAGLEDALRTQT